MSSPPPKKMTLYERKRKEDKELHIALMRHHRFSDEDIETMLKEQRYSPLNSPTRENASLTRKDKKKAKKEKKKHKKSKKSKKERSKDAGNQNDEALLDHNLTTLADAADNVATLPSLGKNQHPGNEEGYWLADSDDNQGSVDSQPGPRHAKEIPRHPDCPPIWSSENPLIYIWEKDLFGQGMMVSSFHMLHYKSENSIIEAVFQGLQDAPTLYNPRNHPFNRSEIVSMTPAGFLQNVSPTELYYNCNVIETILDLTLRSAKALGMNVATFPPQMYSHYTNAVNAKLFVEPKRQSQDGKQAVKLLRSMVCTNLPDTNAMVAMPVQLGNHWLAAFFNLAERKVFCLDSLGESTYGAGGNNKIMAGKMIEFISRVFTLCFPQERNNDWTYGYPPLHTNASGHDNKREARYKVRESRSAVLQPNKYDCGPYVCLFVEFVLHGWPITLIRHSDDIRKRLALTVLRRTPVYHPNLPMPTDVTKTPHE